jgi:hypothetical protein
VGSQLFLSVWAFLSVAWNQPAVFARWPGHNRWDRVGNNLYVCERLSGRGYGPTNRVVGHKDHSRELQREPVRLERGPMELAKLEDSTAVEQPAWHACDPASSARVCHSKQEGEESVLPDNPLHHGDLNPIPQREQRHHPLLRPTTVTESCCTRVFLLILGIDRILMSGVCGPDGLLPSHRRGVRHFRNINGRKHQGPTPNRSCSAGEKEGIDSANSP